jgi:hypothetical protein
VDLSMFLSRMKNRIYCNFPIVFPWLLLFTYFSICYCMIHSFWSMFHSFLLICHVILIFVLTPISIHSHFVLCTHC